MSNNQSLNNQSEAQKPDRSKDSGTKERKQGGNKIGTWLKEIKAELLKIVWPNKKELAKMTLTVIVTSLIFAVLIAGLDTAFGFAVGFLVGLF